MGPNRNLAYAVVFGVAAALIAFLPLPRSTPAAPQTRTFRVEASQFGYSPSELYVSPGDTVILQLVSMDVMHGLYVDGYDVSAEVDPGQSKVLTFVADKPGSFRIRCNVTCGALHPFMIGRLHVGSDTALLRAAGLGLLAVLGGITVMRQQPGA